MQKDESNKLKEKLTEKCRELCNEAKKDPKQLVVGAVILLVAVLLLVLAFNSKDEPQEEVAPTPVIEIEQKGELKELVAKEEPQKEENTAELSDEEDQISLKDLKPAKDVIEIEPKNVVLTFIAKADNDIDYQVFYTVEREVWFDPSHVVTYKAQKGMHRYSIVLPVKEIFRIRLDFGEAPGKVTIKDIYLTGSQKADLNDFTLYNFNQIDSHKINKDNSLTIKATGNDPFMAYERALLAE